MERQRPAGESLAAWKAAFRYCLNGIPIDFKSDLA